MLNRAQHHNHGVRTDLIIEFADKISLLTKQFQYYDPRDLGHVEGEPRVVNS